MKISVLYGTKRNGGIDLLLASLSKQTFRDYELVIVDELTERHQKIREACSWFNIPLQWIGQSKEKSYPDTKYNYLNAFNTGLLHCTGDVVFFVQDYYYIHPEALERATKFYENHPNSLLMCSFFYLFAPEGEVNTNLLDEKSSLSIFKTPITHAPLEQWFDRCKFDVYYPHQNHPYDSGEDRIEEDKALPELVTPCLHNGAVWWDICDGFCPMSLLEKINGFEEYLDYGQDFHEQCIRQKGELLGYDTYWNTKIVNQAVRHWFVLKKEPWDRSYHTREDLNTDRWLLQLWPEIQTTGNTRCIGNNFCLECERNGACALHIGKC